VIIVDLQHPPVSSINQFGYPEKTGFENLISQPEHAGTDINGNEVLVGDSIILLPNGEMLLEDALEDYLIEKLGLVFTTAI
jgi:hypothetical protein